MYNVDYFNAPFSKQIKTRSSSMSRSSSERGRREGGRRSKDVEGEGRREKEEGDDEEKEEIHRYMKENDEEVE